MGESSAFVASMRRSRAAGKLAHSTAAPPDDDPNVKAAVEELERALGTKVRIVPSGPTRGRIEIEYYSTDELHRLYSVIVS